MDNQKQPEEQFSEDVLAAYSDHSPVIEHVRCLYDFSAKTAEELSFRENDELQILGKVDLLRKSHTQPSTILPCQFLL